MSNKLLDWPRARERLESIWRESTRRTKHLALGSAVVLLAAAVGIKIFRARTARTPIVIAVADSFSGKSDFAGPEDLEGAQLYVDSVNDTGGIDGHPIELETYDDQSTGDGAKANVQAIVDSPAVAILGHYLGTAAVEAGQGYREAHISAITGLATSDAVTWENPYYFRSIFVISRQASQVARYLDLILHVPSVTVVYSDDVYGQSYVFEFGNYYAGHFQAFPYDNKAPDATTAIQHVVDQLSARSKSDQLIILAMVDADAKGMLMAMRRHGIRTPVMGTTHIGRDAFAEQFANEPEEQARPGFFTNGSMASPPMIFDSAGDDAQTFFEEFQNRYQHPPTWVEAKSWEASKMLVAAIRKAQVQATPESKQRDREVIRDQLAAMNSRANSVQGLGGPLYFNNGRDMDQQVRIGMFSDRRFHSQPIQLVKVAHPELVDLRGLQASGKILKSDGTYYWKQNVVYTGIDINKLSRVDFKNNTFTADFFLWMRYGGDDDTPTKIEFPTLISKDNFNPNTPFEAGEEHGLHYRLYRVSGDFKASYDLHDYPFDRQDLRIPFQNANVPREAVTYVIDSPGLKLTKNAKPFSSLQSWDFEEVRYTVDTLLSESTRGRLAFFNTSERVEYPGFSAHVSIHRKVSVFLVKSMVAMSLLTLVVFTTLFLPATLIKERVTIPVTAILTSAVLLGAISSQMPEIGYTMAIEYAFYVFFGLCLFVVVISVMEENSRIAKREHLPPVLNAFAKVVYPAVVLSVLSYYYFHYMRS